MHIGGMIRTIVTAIIASIFVGIMWMQRPASIDSAAITPTDVPATSTYTTFTAPTASTTHEERSR